MNANELRIGNIVHSPLWGKNVVVDIDNIRYHDDFIPIKINGDLLVKFGFYCNSKSDYDLNNGSFSLLSNGVEIDLGVEGELLPLSKVINAHQLQNLYFALTGEELTLQK